MPDRPPACPFCALKAELVYTSPLVVAIRDGYPVSPGHTLVIPRRHVADWFEATPSEQAALWDAVTAIKAELDRDLQPDGYNVGFNAGVAAGQTVMHLHVHVIPRYAGDVDDPAGGVRFVIPGHGNYRRPGQIPRALGSGPAWLRDGRRKGRLATGGLMDPFEAHLRPLLREAEQVHIVAAFVQGSGVDLLDRDITAALERGAHFKVITGDYLHITQARALRQLLDWSQFAGASEDTEPGSFEVRVIETKRLDGRSFHPKSWRLETQTSGIAWVGSSNWSWMALTKGVEWNLRIERASDPRAYAEVVEAFDGLWAQATTLTSAWLERYAAEADRHTRALPVGDAEDGEAGSEMVYEPIGVQPDALKALRQSREDGRSRGLVVLATGLGKTFLAAFDVRALAEDLGRTPRVLFVAHRRELLIQASKTFRKVFPDTSIGLFVGSTSELAADFVFASIQKLARQKQLASLLEDRFDYVVVDESHHAPAESYRRVLRQLDPRFMLGLTATPERADDADVARLFDDHVVYRADLGTGIALKRLAPFHYVGLSDTIAFEPIPWRRYTIDELSALAETEARMERLLQAWQDHPGTRTLIFCVSIRHATFVTQWLSARGVRLVAVHSGEGSADRYAALEQLEAGTLDAIATVDLFNEGIDVPLIDRVVMLRPTGSPVVFLQQLGRGLRVAEGKEALQVIDFIGNHRVFLNKFRSLLSLAPKPPGLRLFLEKPDQALELPEGCQIDVELQVVEMMRKFLPSGAQNETIRLYRELRDERGARPAPGELVRMGMNPRSIGGEGWFGFLLNEGDLSDIEREAFELGRRWLQHLERTSMNKSYKMVTLEALLDEDALFTGMSLSELASRSHDHLRRDPTLRADIAGIGAFDEGRESGAWRSYWRKNPVTAWAKGDKRWFDLQSKHITFTLPEPDRQVRDALLAMTRDIVDMRLATYRRRTAGTQDGVSSFVCRVASNKRHPILMLPAAERSELPYGPTDIRLEDGRVWQFKFVKVACNVARPVGARENGLPDLLYGWFGPSAGKPGTDFRVRFSRSPDGWWAEPMGQVVELPPMGEVIAFPDLRAAAGAMGTSQALVSADTVRLPHGGEGRFAVRVSGDSMDGGKDPLRDGDWVILEWSRGRSLDAVAGHICLVARGDTSSGQSHHLKRVVRAGREVSLRSDNPRHPSLEVTPESVVLARQVATVRPEQLAPSRGTVVASVRDAFQLSGEPTSGVSRVDGHLFILVDTPGLLAEPGRISLRVSDRGAAETAFVFTRTKKGWRYAGVGRWREDSWRFPDVDFATWKALGHGRSASRSLDPIWLQAAEHLVTFLDNAPLESWMEGRGKRCRYRGRNRTGSVRVDHEGMKSPRSVTLTDLAWTLMAYEARGDNGGRIDEAWVNFHRYLDGTPKSSTRWIDTGWALVLLDHAIQQGFVASLEPVEGEPFKPVVRGRELDATMHIDRSVLGTSIVLEARGGTAGSPDQRNSEYRLGLQAILNALAAYDGVILDAYVDSTRVSSLPIPYRRLDPGPDGFPLDVAKADLADVVSRFRRSTAGAGRDDDAKGSGNSTRRVRIAYRCGVDLGVALRGG